MRACTEGHDEDYYRELLETITTDWEWRCRANSPSIETAAARAGTGDVGEVFLRHRYTDAILSVTLPHHEDGYAAKMLLDHPLDAGIPNDDQGFIGKLRESQAAIAKGYQSDYLEPVVDTSLVYHAKIPYSYNRELLYTTMLAVSSTALRIQRLHEDVESPLVEVLATETGLEF